MYIWVHVAHTKSRYIYHYRSHMIWICAHFRYRSAVLLSLESIASIYIFTSCIYIYLHVLVYECTPIFSFVDNKLKFQQRSFLPGNVANKKKASNGRRNRARGSIGVDRNYTHMYIYTHIQTWARMLRIFLFLLEHTHMIHVFFVWDLLYNNNNPNNNRCTKGILRDATNNTQYHPHTHM